MERFVQLVAIILAAGILGGIAAFFSQSPPEDPESAHPDARRSWQHFLFLGVVAAACVPLFLSLLKSELIGGIFRAPAGAPAYEHYLIFIGLCLIAAVSARRFIDSITQQFLKRLDEVDAKAVAAAAAAAEAREVAHEAADEIEAADNAGERPQFRGIPIGNFEPASAAESREPMTPTERDVLQAMTRRELRTATGIAEDSGVGRHRISELLESLADKGLAHRTTSPRTRGVRWTLTDRGRAALAPGPEFL